MDEKPQQACDSPTAADSPPQEKAWDVTGFEIGVTDIWVESIQFKAGAWQEGGARNSVPELVGAVAGSDHRGFTAMVRWRFPSTEGASEPRPSGVLGMRFTHKGGLPAPGVEYYSRVNAPILAYPYIREIIAHLTAGARSGPVVIRPLDVPRFVRETVPRWLSDLKGAVRKQAPKEQRGENAKPTQNGSGL